MSTPATEAPALLPWKLPVLLLFWGVLAFLAYDLYNTFTARQQLLQSIRDASRLSHSNPRAAAVRLERVTPQWFGRDLRAGERVLTALGAPPPDYRRLAAELYGTLGVFYYERQEQGQTVRALSASLHYQPAQPEFGEVLVEACMRTKVAELGYFAASEGERVGWKMAPAMKAHFRKSYNPEQPSVPTPAP